MNTREKRILLGAYRDLLRYRTVTTVNVWEGNRPDNVKHNTNAGLAERDIVRLAPADWLGSPQSRADAVGNSRAYRSLESAGLLERVVAHVNYGQRVHAVALYLTPKGQRLAAELLAAEQSETRLPQDEVPADVGELATTTLLGELN